MNNIVKLISHVQDNETMVSVLNAIKELPISFEKRGELMKMN